MTGIFSGVRLADVGQLTQGCNGTIIKNGSPVLSSRNKFGMTEEFGIIMSKIQERGSGVKLADCPIKLGNRLGLPNHSMK